MSPENVRSCVLTRGPEDGNSRRRMRDWARTLYVIIVIRSEVSDKATPGIGSISRLMKLWLKVSGASAFGSGNPSSIILFSFSAVHQIKYYCKNTHLHSLLLAHHLGVSTIYILHCTSIHSAGGGPFVPQGFFDTGSWPEVSCFGAFLFSPHRSCCTCFPSSIK